MTCNSSWSAFRKPAVLLPTTALSSFNYCSASRFPASSSYILTMVLTCHVTLGSFGLDTSPKTMGSILVMDLSTEYSIRTLPGGLGGILTT